MNSVYVINNIVGVESEGSGDFTTQWYQTVGVSIVLVQFGDIVSPHFYKVSTRFNGVWCSNMLFLAVVQVLPCETISQESGAQSFDCPDTRRAQYSTPWRSLLGQPSVRYCCNKRILMRMDMRSYWQISLCV